jgi:hypothetical protein
MSLRHGRRVRYLRRGDAWTPFLWRAACRRAALRVSGIGRLRLYSGRSARAQPPTPRHRLMASRDLTGACRTPAAARAALEKVFEETRAFVTPPGDDGRAAVGAEQSADAAARQLDERITELQAHERAGTLGPACRIELAELRSQQEHEDSGVWDGPAAALAAVLIQARETGAEIVETNDDARERRRRAHSALRSRVAAEVVRERAYLRGLSQPRMRPAARRPAPRRAVARRPRRRTHASSSRGSPGREPDEPSDSSGPLGRTDATRGRW